MNNLIHTRVVIALVAVAMTACTSTDEKKPVPAPIEIDAGKIMEDPLGAELPISETDLEMYTMPTPVQAAAVMKAAEFEYNGSLLVPLNELESTQDLRAVHLGMYMTDLGYTGLFNQRQQSLLYLEKSAKLKNELGIAGSGDVDIARRFEANIDNPDSLSRLILESYSEAHVYFENQERESTGLLILAGCYIEGLYLSVNSHPSAQNQDYQNLVAQQKLFLNSLLNLMSRFNYEGEAAILVEKLTELRDAFKDVKVTYELTDSGKSKQVGGKITDVTATEVRAQVANIRNQILQ